MVADGDISTTGRLLVATFLLPETVTFQVHKDEPSRSNSRGGSIGSTSTIPSTLQMPASQSRPGALIHPLAAVETSNGAMSDHAQGIVPLSVASRGPKMSSGSSHTSPAPSSSPRIYRSTSGEAVTTVPKPISKFDRSKDQERTAQLQRSSHHDRSTARPPSILAPPKETKPKNSTVFAEISSLNHLSAINTTVRRRSSADSAKNYMDASWTVSKAVSGNIGLYNAVNSIQGQLNKLMWIGTLGLATDCLPDKTRGDIKAEFALNHNSVPVFVNDADFDGHYHHFCKQILWPVFHYVLPDNLRSKGYEEGSWKNYVAVNRAFADAIVDNYQPNDTIWVNDYHLLLVPNMIRERLPEASIGFFLHIPFPSSEIFRSLSVRKEVLEGLLGADLIGFQTYSFARHFLQTCSRILSSELSPKGILLENTAVSIGIFPIGIDTKTLSVARKEPDVAQWVNLIKEKYSGMKIIVGRDKLDYVKGVRQKLLAFERFLHIYPEWQGKIVLIQVALSTSEQNEVQGQVSDVVIRINSKFSSLSYQPVVFLRQDITRAQYLGLLTVADLCLITSLRDGMNLTSHEYILCQEEKKSPLILSEFAGTYGSLGACLRVNPWSYAEVAEAIHEGLVMTESEKAERWGELWDNVSTNTAQFWATDFVSELEKVHEDMQRRYSIHIPLLNMEKILPEYRAANRRLLLLDYDGTIVPFERTSTAKSSTKGANERMLKIVQDLASDPRNIVYIMSGRTREALDSIFGHLTNVGLCAEVGCFLKLAGKSTWENQFPEGTDLQWRKQVIEMFEYYKERTPGSEIEAKTIPVVWHYRLADNPNYGLWQARECQNHIEEAIGSIYPIHTVMGRKFLEVLPRDVSKSNSVKTIMEALQLQYGENPVDFVFSIGDDRSDEEMFEYCNELNLGENRVVTCTVGSKSTEARWFVPGVYSVLQSLQELIGKKN